VEEGDEEIAKKKRGKNPGGGGNATEKLHSIDGI